MFDIQCSADIICNALVSTSESLTGMIPQIKQDIASSDVVLYYETGDKINGRNGWTLVAGTRNSTLIYYIYGRNSTVIQEHLPMCKKVVICDGHQAYKIFPMIQRCWAHILREAEIISLRTDDLRIKQLHVTLQNMYCKIRSLEIEDPDVMIKYLLSIIQLYVKFEQERFGRKLIMSSSDLVTFMKYDGVDTTNNAAERELREVVVHRKV